MESKLFLFSLLIVGVLSSAIASSTRLVGGYTPIKDPSDPYVVEIAKFAVSEYNKKTKTNNLVFISVVSGKEQVVVGTNYKLNIKAKSPDVNNAEEYEAVVYDNPGKNIRTLTTFVQIQN